MTPSQARVWARYKATELRDKADYLHGLVPNVVCLDLCNASRSLFDLALGWAITPDAKKRLLPLLSEEDTARLKRCFKGKFNKNKEVQN